MTQDVWIAGMGVVSSIGMNVEENLTSLLNEKSGVGFAEHLNTIHKNTFPVCEIKKSNDELATISNMEKGLPRSVYISAIAAQEAFEVVRCKLNVESDYRIGFISGNTIGGMDLSEDFYAEFLQDKTSGNLKNVVNHECGNITDLVAKQLNIPFSTTISTACSSSANCIIHGSRMIKYDLMDIVIAGGVDALCKFTLNGFNTLMILDTEPSKPFDENRKGLNLGEGAGYVVLVSDKIKNELQLKTFAKVAGYSNANDAFHQTASSAEGNGNYFAMSEALQMSGLKSTDIDYINAHGTGTNNNDSSEGIAIERLFENNIPAVSSTKGFTGHTLGACGGIEAVYCCLAMQENKVFPSLRHETTMKELSFTPIKNLTSKSVNHAMSNSFGFGGNCTSLIFSKF